VARESCRPPGAIGDVVRIGAVANQLRLQLIADAGDRLVVEARLREREAQHVDRLVEVGG